MRPTPPHTAPLFPPHAADAFSEFEQLLVSNSGEDAFDVALQLLIAKLLDEHNSKTAGGREQFTLDGTPVDIFDRVNVLYRQAVRQWPDLGGTRRTIDISPDQLARCVRPLVGWRIIDSDLTHLDAAIERLVAKEAKGALGQYFTPRDVVQLCVRTLAPRSHERVIDPACGSGAFLYEAIKYAKAQDGTPPRCLGIDLGQRSIRVATLLSHAVDPTALRIHRGNAIDGRDYASRPPTEWRDFIAPSALQCEKSEPWGSWHRLTCEVLFTNPPFAGEIDDSEVIAAYDSQRTGGASRKGAIGREHLFIERAINLLKPGGRLAIVVPQGILANATAAYLRHWIMSRCRVLAVVGLHPFAFLPYTGVKTAVLFLERFAHSSESTQDYPIAFMTSRSPGKDSSGRSAGSSDYKQIEKALTGFFQEQRRPWAGESNPASDARVEAVKSSEVVSHGRLDAEYYDPELRRLYFDVQQIACGTLGDRVARSVARFKSSQHRVIDYIDISSVDSRSGVALPTRMESSEAPSRATYLVQPGDILVSTVRPERNVVALVTTTAGVPIVASNGFCVLRPNGVQPEVIFAFCKSQVFRKLLARRATASMYPAATDRDVLDMPFVDPGRASRMQIADRVKQALAQMESARNLIATAITEMDTAIASDPSRSESASLSLTMISTAAEPKPKRAHVRRPRHTRKQLSGNDDLTND